MASHKRHAFNISRVLCLFIGLHFVGDFIASNLRCNVSESLPFWMFKSSSVKELKKGLYVSIKHPASTINLAKQVVGCPGDEVKIERSCVLVAGKDCGIVLEKSRSGQSLKPIIEGIIPEGYFFLHAAHPDSFDSRYEEFGLISRHQIEEVLWPLF